MTKIKIFLIRQLVKLYYRFKFKIVVNFNDFNPKRTDPYFLIGNHAFMHDGLIHAMLLKRYPYPIINAFMFTNEKMKYILTKVIYSIPKRKGQVDIQTVREMMRVVKNEKRGIMVFPEGNASYFGKESDFPFSTVKLFKKFKIDVVVVKTNGAYLSSPRWGLKPTKNGLIELNYHTLFKGSELENYTEEEIYTKLKEALAFNDFDWNRERKYLYKPKERALGLETYIYYCPKCHGHQTLSTKGNQIYCENCGEIAHFNAYSLLSGLDFDNLVEWNNLQKKYLPKILENIIFTTGTMHKVDMKTYELEEMGRVDLEINPISRGVFVQNRDEERLFEIDRIEGLTLTRKREISFDYKKSTFLFKLEDPMLVLDSINYLKGR
ncbi:MAG: lysophospholipid acyltransferase family protein [Candidatus Izemoplasmatales bacterium]